MTSATKTIKINGNEITISLTRDVVDSPNYLDGQLCSTDRKLYNHSEIVMHHKSGKVIRTDRNYIQVLDVRRDAKLIAQGAYASFAPQTYANRETYDAVMAALADLDAEVTTSAEYQSLEQAEAERKAIGEANMARMEAERRERMAHPGWCERCQSYTYGDCGHN